MSSRRTTARSRSARLVAPLLVLAALVGGVLGYQAVTAPSSSTSFSVVPGGPGSLAPRSLTADDGVVPDDGVGVNDDVPAVAHLDPGLLAALREAARAAADDGVQFTVNSGWRSPAYQQQLLREAVSTYGSAEEAARWVATAETSAHVSGDGVDIGPTDAMSWLQQHGDEHGLCQIYGNEPWHYELRPEAADQGCPRTYPDPTHDPRMQQ